jgi:NAD-dependent SIR2 family protein deacetylase
LHTSIASSSRLNLPTTNADNSERKAGEETTRRHGSYGYIEPLEKNS